MILALTFQHLSAEERRRWAAVLRGSQSDAGELELALRYEDRGVVEGKNRGKYPERVRLVKFDSSIKHSSDVVLLWENYLTLVSQNGVLSLKQEPKLTDLSDFFKVVDDRGKLCVKFKLTTNITSKSHDNRRFRFTSRARRGSSSDYLGKSLTGESFDFELVAKHRTQAASNATKSVQRTVAKVQAAAFEAPLPAEELPPLKLTSATSDGAPGDTVTCFGSENISDTGVVAEFTMVEGGRKRKRNTTLTRRLKRLEPSDPGTFVTRLPLDIPPGTYSIRLIIGASEARASNSVSVSVVEPPAPPEMPIKAARAPQATNLPIKALRAPKTQSRFHCEPAAMEPPPEFNPLDYPSEMPLLLRRDSSHQLFKCDSSLNLCKQYSTSWPQSKAIGDEVLPPPEVANSKPCLRSSLDKSELDLVPTNSELTLSYCQPSAKLPGMPMRDLSRSISEENLDKMASNCNMLSTTLGESDVVNITRNLWLNGPNLNNGMDAEPMQTDEPSSDLCLGRTRSMSLCRQASDNVLQFLADESEVPTTAVVQSAVCAS
eukprot:TRINITY_DN2543_c0_g1_i8.p1 TRINITY_DN2543_c0_g1~~TRINITY_DN2543_c0_g1_i8.p1  ORF type:complete len:545 (+),score=119.33 TRINITY_DN2543_c0_g1_i8:259-1893(+)